VKEIWQIYVRNVRIGTGGKIRELQFWVGSCTQAANRVTHIAVFGGFFGSPPTKTLDNLKKGGTDIGVF
jgi:hypothetical protein